jgi:hypothetical protein
MCEAREQNAWRNIGNIRDPRKSGQIRVPKDRQAIIGRSQEARARTLKDCCAESVKTVPTAGKAKFGQSWQTLEVK